MDTFLPAAESIQVPDPTILNYFLTRHINPSAESYNRQVQKFPRVHAKGQTQEGSCIQNGKAVWLEPYIPYDPDE